jgi:hypothetical protein
MTTAPAKKTAAPAKKTAAPPKPTAAPTVNVTVSTGSDKIDALVRALDDVELTDQHSLHAFCEALRKLSHKLAVETAIASGQLSAGAKAMAKGSGNPFLMGLDVKVKIRRVTKSLESASDHLGDASSAAVLAWSTFEAEFEEVLSKSSRQPATPRSFHISED